MALGSLLDAGADVGEVRALLARLPLPGWGLTIERVLRGGIACTAAIVERTAEDPVSRGHADIVAIIDAARLPDRVAARAKGAFALLAEVEGHLHGVPADKVHFHEVGGHDAVIDVVGTASALEVLGVDEIAASAVATGTGTISTAHGVLPNPAPAVVRLLQGVPTYGRPTPVELTTPTGAAILAAMAGSFGPMPAMTVAASGFGAGRRELPDMPNCTQVVIGESATVAAGDEPPGQPVLMLETNVDDVTGEELAHAVRALLDAGAHDAWISPIIMKKGRPGHTVHVLGDPAAGARLREVLRQTTGTFGVRAFDGSRWPSARVMAQVEVDGEMVTMKVGPHRAKVEFDDAARVAAITGEPVHQVRSRAEAAWRRRQPPA
jgi:hypothetical protein